MKTKVNKLRQFVLLAITTLTFSATGSLSYGQGNFAGVELSITPVSGDVYMVQRPGGGGNIGVQVGPDGVLLVDSLFAPLTERLVAAVKQVTDEEIRFPDKSLFLYNGEGDMIYCEVDDEGNPRCEEVDVED